MESMLHTYVHTYIHTCLPWQELVESTCFGAVNIWTVVVGWLSRRGERLERAGAAMFGWSGAGDA